MKLVKFLQKLNRENVVIELKKIAKFWAELHEIDDDDKKGDYIWDQAHDNPAVLHSTDPSCSEKLSITEYLCSINDPSCMICEVLGIMINDEHKVPVTQRCYEYVTRAGRDYLNINMLEHLLNSGVLPSEIDGEKPMDNIIDVSAYTIALPLSLSC